MQVLGMVYSMVNLYRARYSMAGENISMYGYLLVWILVPLLIKFIKYGEKVITYLDYIK